MADRKIGIAITAKDTASGTFKGMATAGKASLKTVRTAADKAKNAFKVMGGVTTALNQGLELAKKGWELFRMAILDTVTAALDFRDKNDPVIKQFKEMKRSAELLRARLGDALIPVLQAVAAAFGPVSDGMSNWVAENRKLIASKLLSFLGQTAKILNTGIATAIIIVSKAWTGWRLIIEGTKAVVNTFFSLLLDGTAIAIAAMKTLAEITGSEGVAASLGEAEDAVRGLGATFSESASESVDEMHRLVAAQDELEAQVIKTSEAIDKAINEGIVAGQIIVQNSIAGTNKSLEEQEAAAARAAEAAAERARLAQELADELSKAEQERLRAEVKAFEDAEKAKATAADKEMAAREAMIESAGNAFKQLTELVVQGYLNQSDAGEEAAEKNRKATIMAVLDIITAFAAEAAAGIFAKTIEALGFPAGPIAGAALAAATGAAILGLKAGVAASFADGGFVRGGTPGRDTVPIMAQDGEFVMSKSDVMGFRKFASRILGSSSGTQLADVSRGTNQARTQAGDLTENTTIINRVWVPSRIDEMRMSQRQARARIRLRDLGALPAGA